ncbi:uncharacterized protein LOC112971630 isoform X1 [Apteryx rowi]|uniref:uncharacterized protein LOC112971630 isoform X1 n=1 Tax=Apteryx rowi TaxID=308060 RepID=UPI000E1C76AE|nr:uncharacterized protein LOC112971630 isoform X1 [Apteryx rowi]
MEFPCWNLQESSESQRLKLPVGLCQEARCEVPSAVWAGFVFTLVDFHVWELHTSTLTQQRFLVRRNGIPRSCQNWTEIAALLCNKGKRIQQATPEICVQLFLCLYCNNPKSPMTSCVSLREQLSPFSPKRTKLPELTEFSFMSEIIASVEVTQDLSPVLCNNNRNGESVKSWDSLPKLQLVFATKKGSKLGGYMRGRVALPFPYFLHCFPTHLLVTVGDRAPGQNYLWTEPVWDE